MNKNTSGVLAGLCVVGAIMMARYSSKLYIDQTNLESILEVAIKYNHPDGLCYPEKSYRYSGTSCLRIILNDYNTIYKVTSDYQTVTKIVYRGEK